MGALQRPTATRVAGIRTWNLFGRFVKREEKGILILAPMVGRRNQQRDAVATEIARRESVYQAQLLGEDRTSERLVFCQANHPVRETEAEAVAFVVCQSIGLKTGTASTDYIQLWNGDAKLLQESLEVVQRTAAVILGGIVPKPAAPTGEDAGNRFQQAYAPQPSLTAEVASVDAF